MHHFPKADLRAALAQSGDTRALALLASLRFIAADDFVRAGVDEQTLDALAASELVLRIPLQRTLTVPRPVTVFALRRAGAVALANALQVDPDTIHSDTLSTCRRSAIFLDHSLARSRFAIQLAVALEASGPTLERWETDESRLEISGSPPVPERGPRDGRLVPDAAARIARSDADEVLIVEIDRGTERLPVLTAKCSAYACLWRCGLLAKRFSAVAVRVLWVAPTERRAEKLTEAARAATGGRMPGLFWAASEADIARRGITAPIWRTMKRAGLPLWRL